MAEALSSDTPPSEPLKGLPDVKVQETADEEKFDCPPAWYLVVNAIGMSAITALTVVGAFAFLLAAPEKITSECYEWDYTITRALCTTSTVAFWTYPIVCVIFVGLIFTKNMVDARMYYEFLLHGVCVGYSRRSILKIFNYPALPILLAYCVLAMTSLGWHWNSFEGRSDHKVVVLGYAYMAYLTPVISFVATLITKWSVQYFLIPLCEFLEDFDWAQKHLAGARCYPFETIHMGYIRFEAELTEEHGTIDTPRLVAYVDHYCKEQQKLEEEERRKAEAAAAEPVVETGPSAKAAKDVAAATAAATAAAAQQALEASKKILDAHYARSVFRKFVYWPVRMFFNRHLKDARSWEFQVCSVAYLVVIVLVTIWGIYMFFCCVITALQLERVLVDPGPGSVIRRPLIHYFSFLHDHPGFQAEQQAVEAEVSRAFQYKPGKLRSHPLAELAPGF